MRYLFDGMMQQQPLRGKNYTSRFPQAEGESIWIVGGADIVEECRRRVPPADRTHGNLSESHASHDG
jgi:hypothetical protein